MSTEMPRTFVIESFDEHTGTGIARDIQTNASFSFDRAGLSDEMDSVCFPGEYVVADVVDDRITNLSATEKPWRVRIDKTSTVAGSLRPANVVGHKVRSLVEPFRYPVN